MGKIAVRLHASYSVIKEAEFRGPQETAQTSRKGEFIDSVCGMEELGDRWRRSEMSYPQRFHDV